MSELSTETANEAVLQARKDTAVDIWFTLAAMNDQCVQRSEASYNIHTSDRWMSKAMGLRIGMDLISRKFQLTKDDLS